MSSAMSVIPTLLFVALMALWTAGTTVTCLNNLCCENRGSAHCGSPLILSGKEFDLLASPKSSNSLNSLNPLNSSNRLRDKLQCFNRPGAWTPGADRLLRLR
jgi:hypothetical protein